MKMSETHDMFLRAHTVVLDEPERSSRARKWLRDGPTKWPEWALVFDCESRRFFSQGLTFGFYRLMRLKGDSYVLVEEGAFFDDNLSAREVKVLRQYMATAVPDVTSFPPRFPLHSRSEFIRKVFYKYARKGALIVGFNLCFDLARIACKWTAGDKDEWSLVLSEYRDGNENLHHPRVLITPIDSKKAFIRFRAEWVSKDGKAMPTDINKARFLDLRTLLWALFHKALSLKTACDLEAFKKYRLPKKREHTPTGQVTIKEIEYARQDTRCTAALLNAAKREFDFHPLELSPARAYSPASMVKAYLDAMGIEPPSEKFDVPDEILGIAMESFTAGRSETKIRHVEVPVVPVDFTSEYPTVCALLELMDVLTAESLRFEDSTADVIKLLGTIALDRCFDRKLWPDFRFFALLIPDGDILPVRTMYNGFTQNVGNNYLTSDRPLWFAGPDVINSVIQTGKIPRIVRAIKMVPQGKQPRLRPAHLRGAVAIDPRQDDLFRKIIEERKRHESDKDLYHWLKVFANAIYGCFVEINPEQLPERKPARVRVYSGEEFFVPEQRYHVVERHGRWYAPYLASLITSGGRLLLGMLERCIAEQNGVYAWADTDALAVVSTARGGLLDGIPGCEHARILPRFEVQRIIDRFAALNPYDFGGSILRLVANNYVDSDPNHGFRQLRGFSISAKRYAIYERNEDKITIVDPKGHGLGYLYPPFDSPKGWDDEHDAPKWIHQAWEFLLRKALHLRRIDPAWLRRPQMMRMAVTTHSLLKRLHGWEGFRPYNFFFLPIVAPGGYPADIDPKHFTLVAPFEKNQRKWIDSVCLNIDDLSDPREYRVTTDFDSPNFGERAVLDTFERLLYRYQYHPESKSLAWNGGPCKILTHGLLERAHITAGRYRRIGKEVDRRWEEGDDLDAARQQPIEYQRAATRTKEPTLRPTLCLSLVVRRIGIRKLMRHGLGRRILQKICRREPVTIHTLREYEYAIRQYTSKTRRMSPGG